MTRPRLLDLFSGAGGAAMGYHRAGFDVVGVDLSPQPRYPFTFIQADAMTYPLDGFDAIHASPPCQGYSQLTGPAHRASHDRLIPAVRERLVASGVPFVIENVPGARLELRDPLMLCSTMFGLPMQRHRYFEVQPPLLALLPPCAHIKDPVCISGVSRRKSGRHESSVTECRQASGIDWMTRAELDNAIPPAYTAWIGKYLMAAVCSPTGIPQ